MPFISSQVPGSIPDWARGAAVVESTGPFFTDEGKPIWFDHFRVVQLIQVCMQGAPRPIMLLPLEVLDRPLIRDPRMFRIAKGSVWIHADLFNTTAPDNYYCGLTVSGGFLRLSQVIAGENNKITIPTGIEVSVELDLEQPEIAEQSPDEHGIDVKESKIDLPKKFAFTFSHTTKTFSAEKASWDLFGQKIKFDFDTTQPMRWEQLLNRIAIPYKADVAELDVQKSKSPFCTITGRAPIVSSAWLLSTTAIDINAPLQAEGIGAMAVGVIEGLNVTYSGLKDANLKESSNTSLLNAMVMLMPGRLNVSTLFARNITGRQRFDLWRGDATDAIEMPLQYIDLEFTKQFFFFYDATQKGVETVAVQTNCRANINKPVAADGQAFPLESLQTLCSISMSQDKKRVILFDDNLLQDNWSKTYKPIPGVPEQPLQFESHAIALNNALLTVSPVYGFMLNGELKDESSFANCSLAVSFGLLRYLPTLPDPYAANVSLFMRRGRFTPDENRHFLAEIIGLLTCNMTWQSFDEPQLNFVFGNRPANIPYALANSTVASNVTGQVGIEKLKDVEFLEEFTKVTTQREAALRTSSWTAVNDNEEESRAAIEQEMRQWMVAHQRLSGNRTRPFMNGFTLLDVSTNADLMGVNFAFATDNYIYDRTHVAKNQIEGNPLTINGLDVHATSRLVQVYALPQISWEPMINLSEVSNDLTDPYPGILYFLNDGTPAYLANLGNEQVNLAPLPLTQKVTELYNNEDVPLWSYFTLSNGMLAVGMYYEYDGQKPVVELIRATFNGILESGLQVKTVGFYDNINKHRKFLGSAHQLSNINNLLFPGTNNRSVLSGSVTEIFNDEFGSLGGFDLDKYIPLERYDFSGYGANVFSHWVNANAAIAQTSQAMFDVWRGRTAHEVIQVKSVIYPWGIRVVRTITIYRGSNGFPWRTDSGWKAESDGIFDFRTPIKDSSDPTVQAALEVERDRTYIFHPGMVEGVYNVRNIKEDTTLAPYKTTWTKTTGVYIDDQGHPKAAPPPPEDSPLEVKLIAVYFDADVQIDNVTQGAKNGKVFTQRMLGYLQLRPRGVFIDAEDFASMLTKMDGIGGPVDCIVNINNSKQSMRISRVEVKPSMDALNRRVFVVAAKGTPILPKDGSWSVVEHNLATKEVLPLSGNDVVPLVREGERIFPDLKKQDYQQDKDLKPVNVAEQSELFKALDARAKQFGFLQSTGENKILFRNPLFEKDTDILKGSVPDLADAYRLLNSKGIFPKLEDLPKITEMSGDFVMNIKEEGYKLLNKLDPVKKLSQELPKGPWYIVDTKDVKVYIEYQGKENGADKKAFLDLDIDSAAQTWLNKMNDITMFVDLGASFEKVLLIRGKFDTKKGSAPNFIEPVLEFGPQLKPVYDILVLLSELAVNPNYTDILKKGLKIAMSNSPNNWEYKFQADKEIPVLRFPPPNLDTAAAPLRLEAGLKAGVYFNVAIPLPPTGGVPAPSAGAFIEFYGKLSVMCASVGVGSIYAVGQVTVRISADTIAGPALHMKFGFGVEAVVALPVIGSVSIYFAAGVEMSLSTTELIIGGFILFRGRADILGGIVTVTIQIEASGKVRERIGGASGETSMVAQVTFSLDISVCFIIDISFTEQWQETKQIA